MSKHRGSKGKNVLAKPRKSLNRSDAARVIAQRAVRILTPKKWVS
jgi:hypothetical protein